MIFSYKNKNILLLLLFLFIYSKTSVAKSLEISINMDNEKFNQFIHNNQILGTGYVKNDGVSYIIISSKEQKVPGLQATYIFRGKNNPKNKIAIRLGGEGWHPDKSGLGIISRVNTLSKFKLYSVNNYRINPDVYFVHLFAKEVKIN